MAEPTLTGGSTPKNDHATPDSGGSGATAELQVPRRCPICGCPSDYHGFGCMGSWAEPCDCNLTAEQVERVSADA